MFISSANVLHFSQTTKRLSKKVQPADSASPKDFLCNFSFY